jgi:hypothetical protein
MKRSLLLAAVLLAVVCATGCNPRLKEKAKATEPAVPAGPGGAAPEVLTKEEALAQEAIALLQRATELLKSIRDEKSATAVAPKLKAIALQLQDLNRRGLPLGSELKEKPQVLGRFRGQMDKVLYRYSTEAVRVEDQANLLGPEFHDAVREINKLLQ